VPIFCSKLRTLCKLQLCLIAGVDLLIKLFIDGKLFIEERLRVCLEFGERRAPNHMVVIVRPTLQDGVEGLDELCPGTPCGSLTTGFHLGSEGLETCPARRDLKLGRVVAGPLMLAQGLP
jgi:hypothetical protein